MSPGKGASNRIAAPLTGWSKPRRPACSAWRGKAATAAAAPRAPARAPLAPFAAIDRITDQPVPGVGHVHPDLVRAPGFQPAFHQRQHRRRAEALEHAHRVTAWRPP
jgi:hypothetical protein